MASSMERRTQAQIHDQFFIQYGQRMYAALAEREKLPRLTPEAIQRRLSSRVKEQTLDYVRGSLSQPNAFKSHEPFSDSERLTSAAESSIILVSEVLLGNAELHKSNNDKVNFIFFTDLAYGSNLVVSAIISGNEAIQRDPGKRAEEQTQYAQMLGGKMLDQSSYQQQVHALSRDHLAYARLLIKDPTGQAIIDKVKEGINGQPPRYNVSKLIKEFVLLGAETAEAAIRLIESFL